MSTHAQQCEVQRPTQRKLEVKSDEDSTSNRCIKQSQCHRWQKLTRQKTALIAVTCFWPAAAQALASMQKLDKALTMKWQALDPASQEV